MKSQRRHELQHNTLDAELHRMVSFFKTHGTKVAWGILLIAAVILAIVGYRRYSERNLIDIQNRYNQVLFALSQPGGEDQQILQELHDLAGQDTVEWVAVDAALRIGTIYAEKAIQADSDDQQTEYRQEAIRQFERVIEAFADSPVAVGRAKVALARLHEQEDPDKAQEYYQSVESNEALNGYPVQLVARQSLMAFRQGRESIHLARNVPQWLSEIQAGESTGTEQDTEPQTTTPQPEEAQPQP